MSELVFSRVLLEKYNRVLTIVVMVLLTLNVIFLFWIMNTTNKPQLVVFAKQGQLEVLKSNDLKVDEVFIKDFTKMIVGQYLSFSGDSLVKQIEELRVYIADKPVNAILNSFKDNQAIIARDAISQQFIINSISITKKTNPFWVEIDGVRTIHAKANDKSSPIIYVAEIKKVKANEENPYGLLMTDIIEKSPSKGQVK